MKLKGKLKKTNCLKKPIQCPEFGHASRDKKTAPLEFKGGLIITAPREINKRAGWCFARALRAGAPLSTRAQAAGATRAPTPPRTRTQTAAATSAVTGSARSQAIGICVLDFIVRAQQMVDPLPRSSESAELKVDPQILFALKELVKQITLLKNSGSADLPSVQSIRISGGADLPFVARAL